MYKTHLTYNIFLMSSTNRLFHELMLYLVVSDSSQPMDCSLPGSLSVEPPGKETGAGTHSLPQGIFLTQGSNLILLHCRQHHLLGFEIAQLGFHHLH